MIGALPVIVLAVFSIAASLFFSIDIHEQLLWISNFSGVHKSFYSICDFYMVGSGVCFVVETGCVIEFDHRFSKTLAYYTIGADFLISTVVMWYVLLLPNTAIAYAFQAILLAVMFILRRLTIIFFKRLKKS